MVYRLAVAAGRLHFTAVASSRLLLSSEQTSQADRLGVPAAIGNAIGMRTVLIPSGEFMMGSDNEKPVHAVRVTRPFYVGVTEVTQKHWRSVMGSEPGSSSSYKGRSQDAAANRISWNDATEFCRQLSVSTGKTVRLPTEAEWEYACRAGSTGKYCFGNDESKLGEHAWYGYDDNAGRKTHPAGQKRPNAWGLCDMHGNVWEWCQDWHGDYPPDPVTDPTGPSSGSCRVLRGGSWDRTAHACRSAFRVLVTPTSACLTDGFRVILAQDF